MAEPVSAQGGAPLGASQALSGTECAFPGELGPACTGPTVSQGQHVASLALWKHRQRRRGWICGENRVAEKERNWLRKDDLKHFFEGKAVSASAGEKYGGPVTRLRESGMH